MSKYPTEANHSSLVLSTEEVSTGVELLAIGAGPANLALAVALEELAPELAARTLIVEQHPDIAWQRGMLLPWAQSQVSFLKDLVTLRNPRSAFTFVNPCCWSLAA